MSLKHSYTLLAPVYDLMVSYATQNFRPASLARLNIQTDQKILIAGIGTGLDIPHLPQQADYLGVDLTYAMLKRAQNRTAESTLQLQLCQGNVMQLPCADNTFDHIVMHLILSVVPDPVTTLQEMSRALKPGGQIVIVDKFLRRGERAWLKRIVNPIMRRIATRTDVVFEDVLEQSPALQVQADKPLLAGGWFRNIHLYKSTSAGNAG